MNGNFRTKILALGLILLAASSVAQPADHDMAHMAPQGADARKPLDFPGPMREHMLSNMRGHLDAIGEILGALSTYDGAKAANIARSQLGLESPHAAACDPKRMAKGGAMGDMAQMMARHMPEEMRAMGYAMHESASQFAVEAEKLKPDGDPKPALAALAKVAENCSSCHAAYRLR